MSSSLYLTTCLLPLAKISVLFGAQAPYTPYPHQQTWACSWVAHPSCDSSSPTGWAAASAGVMSVVLWDGTFPLQQKVRNFINLDTSLLFPSTGSFVQGLEEDLSKENKRAMMSSPLKAVGSVTMKGRRISKKDKSDVVLQPWFQYSSSTDLLPFKDTTQSFIVLQGLKFLFVQTLDISHFLLPLGVCFFFDVRNQAQHFLSRIRLLRLFFSTVILAFI